MKILRTGNQWENQEGMTLLECLVALVVTLVGVLAVFVLITYSVQMHVDSRDTARANALAKAKVEELKNTTRVAGGDLNSNVSGYFDSPAPNYVRRWQVTDDTYAAQVVAVRMVATNPGMRLPPVMVVTRMR